LGLRTDCYAKVWAARPVGKTYSVQVSVSYKDKNTGKYKNSMNGYVTFAGDAASKIKELNLPEKIDKENPKYRSIKIVGSPDVSNYFNAEKYKSLLSAAKGNDELVKFIKANASPLTVTIWDFELAEDSYKGSGKNASSKKSAKPSDDEDEDEDLPF